MGPKHTHEFDYNDPFSFSDSPEAAKEAASAELSESEEEKRGHLANAAVAHKAYVEETSRDKNWGHRVPDDPIHGSSDNRETINQSILDDIDRNSQPMEEVLEPKPEIADTKTEVKTSPALPEEEQNAEQDPTLIAKEEHLREVFDMGKQERDSRNEPGSYELRVLSVAATEMKQVDQPEEPKERIKAINTEIEKAIKEATGGEDPGKYEGDTQAAVQAYISELLIGDQARPVMVGTTKTIVNSNGQIGRDPKIYKDLVVVRWIENRVNHVLAFSPRRDARVYFLVDNDNGDSLDSGWRHTFLLAGAVNGKERGIVSELNHEHHTEVAHHEKTFEKVVYKMLEDDLKALRTNVALSSTEKAEAESSIAKKIDKLAYYHGALKKNSDTIHKDGNMALENAAKDAKTEENDG